MRIFLFIALWIWGPLVVAAESPVAVMPEKHLAMMEKHCFECHDAETEKGNVNLEDLSFTVSLDIPTAERWKQILNAINSGDATEEEFEDQ